MFLTVYIYIHMRVYTRPRTRYNVQRTVAMCVGSSSIYKLCRASYVVFRVLCYCMMYIRCTVTRNSQRRRLCFIKVHAAQQGATLPAAYFIYTCRCCPNGRCPEVVNLPCSRRSTRRGEPHAPTPTPTSTSTRATAVVWPWWRVE